MSDLEYFGTIAAFVAGSILLIYLIRIRKVLMRKAKIRLLQAKAKIHHMTRPSDDVLLPLDYEIVGIDEAAAVADTAVYNTAKRDIR